MLQPFIKSWSGYGVRHIPDGDYDIYDFSRAGLATDNRWNIQGDSTLYLASEKDVALGEWSRHLQVERSVGLVKKVKRRKVYRFEVKLTSTIDLCDRNVWQVLSLQDARNCFLNKDTARAIAGFIRHTTQVEAIFVPSVVFLDCPDKWVLVVFLEKLSTNPYEFLPSCVEDGYFAVDS
ncbi:RES family NAD+ phosphorylase [Chlorogloea sp. CCALA 695]|uniref:RES family NAD+ phosphorylase n=1 Tax=Chlorogloea sp. CCALA 695 TaxID=2107693 RepID=UPI000D077BCB|nr:RES family NAD+ phosphorylase [Chlorogloea sp. CCALA 695]PSB30370.1 RES domain-containing protein [Chlorogloea sp. CCALA 695]